MSHLIQRTSRSRQRGFSVLELLIATTIAMVILLVVTKWFRDLSNATAKSRALVEMSGQLRSVIAQLESDMRGATYPHGAMPGTVAPMGYIQYVEGMAKDAIPAWPMQTLPPNTGTSLNMPAVSYRNNSGLIPASPSGIPAHFANIRYKDALTGNLLDASPNYLVDQSTSRFGDLDDVLSLTTRNLDSPYRGSILLATTDPTPNDIVPQSIESPLAEVVWWVQGLDENGDGIIADAERQVHRRLFLIRPDLTGAINTTWRKLRNPAGGSPPGFALSRSDALQIMYEQCDISFTISVDGSGNETALANSLADLAAPSSQAADSSSPTAPCRRITLGIPHRVQLNAISFPKEAHLPGRNIAPTRPALNRSRYGEDVMISSVAAFDIRIYDDVAPLWGIAGVTLNPGDPGYTSTGATKVGQGAFVDLNYALVRDPTTYGTASSYFSGPPSEYSGFLRVPVSSVAATTYSQLLTAFDTWAPAANNAMDGVDSNAPGTIIGVIDDEAELLAELPTSSAPGQYFAPPYSSPLRALQVTLRTYDPDSRQIRQLKASASFTRN